MIAEPAHQLAGARKKIETILTSSTQSSGDTIPNSEELRMVSPELTDRLCMPLNP